VGLRQGFDLKLADATAIAAIVFALVAAVAIWVIGIYTGAV